MANHRPSPERLDILLVSSKYPPEYSGSGHRAHWLYQRLLRKRPSIQLSVAAGSETRNTVADYEVDSVRVRRVACKPFPATTRGEGFMARTARAFQNSSNFSAERTETLRLIRSLPRRPDLIHVFGQNYVTATALAFARREGVPVILELCNEMETPLQYVPFPDRVWVSNRLPQRLSIVCISERLRLMCERMGFGAAAWCRPNPIDEARFHPVSATEKTALRMKNAIFPDSANSDKLLVYVAKFIPRKNHVFLPGVLSMLPEECKLVLAGPLAESGPLADRDRAVVEEVRREAVRLGVASRVDIRPGFVPNVDEFYKMADIYLFPTKEEGLGTPMLESVACATPVVANIIPGITDSWIHDGRNGFVRPLDAGLFAEAVRQAIQIPRDRMEAEAAAISGTAGSKAVDAQYLELIDRLASDRLNSSSAALD